MLGSDKPFFVFLKIALLCLMLSGGVSSVLIAQDDVVSGKITDVKNGEPIPFANVTFLGSNSGTISDFEGNYSISHEDNRDTLVVSHVGYVTLKVPVEFTSSPTKLNISLEEAVVNLQEVVVSVGEYENPAHAIMRKVIAHKPFNDKRELTAFEYDSYSKLEVDLSNMAGPLKHHSLFKQLSIAYDSLQNELSETGATVLPIFFSEALSKVYYRNNPHLRKEKMLKSNIKGVGIQEGGILSQVLGSSLQDFNFYENWLRFFDKDLVSPIADGWKIYYNYTLSDSLFIGEDFCYRIAVSPKRDRDLAFTGTIWITKETYALKQLDLVVGKSANLNFINKLRIQQKLVASSAGNWLPEKNRLFIAVNPFQLHDTEFLVKAYTSNSGFEINQPQALQFYNPKIEVAPDAIISSEDFWIENRHDSLSQSEVDILQIMDTINDLPKVRRTMKLARTLGTGYYEAGKVEIGPYPFFYLYNNIEGSRPGFGLRTNKLFSRKLRLSGLAAYGIRDERLKYNFSLEYIFSHEKWTIAKFEVDRDLEQVGLDPDEIRANYFFYASSKWGKLVGPYYYDNTRLSLQTDLWRGGTASLALRYRGFDPLYVFQHTVSPEEEGSPTLNSFSSTEVNASLRISRKEDFFKANYRRYSLRNSNWPVVTLKYTYGMKGVLQSDFEYHKIDIGLFQRVNLAFLGTLNYTLEAGKIFNPLPYPLLNVHIGNESLFYTSAAFNQMDYMEFVSDQYASLHLLHNFEGNILNRLPLIRKLNWRLLVEGKFLLGNLGERNQLHLESSGTDLTIASELRGLGQQPYVELGYGLENILRFIRIGAYHRITYRDRPDIRKFGVKISGQFAL